MGIGSGGPKVLVTVNLAGPASGVNVKEQRRCRPTGAYALSDRNRLRANGRCRASVPAKVSANRGADEANGSELQGLPR